MKHKLRFCRFCVYDISYMLRYKVILCLIVLALIIIWNFGLPPKEPESSEDYSAIDVVYTWVNGSDPEFVNSIRQYDPYYDPSRYTDKDELKYSLRSLEKYAPWVRHVYIVTNGQIPHWLDLSYRKVSVVPHNKLAKYPEFLPTFSSPAIETFIHRIPNLSKRFVYLNDDIFLGAQLYPEDLYTESEGVRVYTAWSLPDCAPECPWLYLGDGACDKHCNNEACQFDGGDCDHESLHPPPTNEPKSQKPKSSPGEEPSSFQDVIKKKKLTIFEEMKTIVDSFNDQQKHKQKPKTEDPQDAKKYTSTTDVFSDSLKHTNRLLNRAYGFINRKVLGHVGFLLDRDIIEAMQEKFNEEFMKTASHRFRDRKDMQFAFTYYSFVMSETYNETVDRIFDEFDTDGSQTWSDREIRTFLSRIYRLPLDWSVVRYFEEVITNCSESLGPQEHMEYITLVYERYEDSNLPKITKYLVTHCPTLVEVLRDSFAERLKYKFVVNPKRASHSNFMMLKSNVTEVVNILDRFRSNPKKFNCINDNLDYQYVEENELVLQLLEDFYLSFFPKRSRFELPEKFRNRFNNFDDYERWRLQKSIALCTVYSASMVFIVFLLKYCCMHKAKFVRRYVQSW